MIAIDRVLKVPYQTVGTWMRRRSEKNKGAYVKKVKNLVVDKMKSYVSKKQNDYWIWTVVADKNIKNFLKLVREMKKPSLSWEVSCRNTKILILMD